MVIVCLQLNFSVGRIAPHARIAESVAPRMLMALSPLPNSNPGRNATRCYGRLRA